MVFRSCLLAVAICSSAASAFAGPRVLLDTEAGPILFELDDARAPRAAANLLRYVNDGFYDGLIFHRTVKDFVVQAGRLDEQGQLRAPTYAAIAGEPGNGLSNTYGTVSMALAGSDVNTGRSEFFINTGDNASLDGTFTAFGRVVYGMSAVEEIDERATYFNQTPFRPVRIRKAAEVAAGAFPILDAHSGSWFDPANSGRGIVLEIAGDPSDLGRRTLVAYGYDYREGDQVWVNGASTFEVGDHEITVPMQTSSGADFGSAFSPGSVQFEADWGTLHVRFSACDLGTFTYTSRFGTFTQNLTRITAPSGRECEARE